MDPDSSIDNAVRGFGSFELKLEDSLPRDITYRRHVRFIAQSRTGNAGTLQGVIAPEGVKAIEEQYFNNALNLSNGNESKAAQLLNLTRDKFRYRRQKLAL